MAGLSMTRPGFSLLEVITVMTIIGLVLATVSLSWLSPLRKAQFSETIRKVQATDQQNRLHSRSRNAATRIVLDIAKNEISYSRYSNQGIESRQLYELPKGHWIESVRDEHGFTFAEEFEYIINSYGISQSFAVLLKDRSNATWISFAGGTGQSQTHEDESQIGFPDAQ